MTSQGTREEFVKAAQEAGFATGKPCPTCEGSGSVPGGPVLLHTFAGPFGADWDMDAVVAFLRDADEVGWDLSALGHDLYAVKRDGGRVRLVRFQVKAPVQP